MTCCSGALGACTSMTLRMFADRKGWPLDHITVTLSHTRHHADDAEDCETEPRIVYEFTLLNSKRMVTTLAAPASTATSAERT